MMKYCNPKGLIFPTTHSESFVPAKMFPEQLFVLPAAFCDFGEAPSATKQEVRYIRVSQKQLGGTVSVRGMNAIYTGTTLLLLQVSGARRTELNALIFLFVCSSSFWRKC